jgi:uncharacterized protein (DUF58 family)
LTTLVSSRLRAYLLIAAVGTLGGLLLERPEPVVVAAPFLIASAVGLALARSPRLEVTVGLDRERALEGDEVVVAVEVTARQPVARLQVDLQLPRGLRAVDREESGRGRLAAGASRGFRLRVRCDRWGGRLVGRVRVRARDPLGFFYYEQEAAQPLALRVYPRGEALLRLLRPAETQSFAGNEASRLSGDGIEFADIRAFVPGDRVRRINWRATARRGQLQVNQMRPERNADVVLFLDTFSELRGGADSTIDLAVRAATALLHAYLGRRDRVGLIGFGGTLRWLRPEMGERQLYRVLDALIDTEVVLSYAWKGLEVIPRQTLPPGALVVALTPLIDERAVEALLDLRGRGHDLAVVEISPLAFLRPGPRPSDQLAYRLWAMERAALRGRFLALGVPAIAWSPGTPLQAALAEADRFRRDARVARA